MEATVPGNLNVDLPLTSLAQFEIANLKLAIQLEYAGNLNLDDGEQPERV